MIKHEYAYPANIRYKEDINLSWSVRVYIFAIYIILLTMLVATAIIDPPLVWLSEIVAASVTVAFVSLYLNFRALRIEISENHLDVRYGKFQRKVIPITEMVRFEHIQIRFKDYGGIGIRWGRDGTWAYNTKLGDAVKITITNDRPFAFSTAHPTKVCEVLRDLRD